MKLLSLSLMLMLSTCYAGDANIQKLSQTHTDASSVGSEIDLQTSNNAKKITASYFEGVKKNSLELCIALASCIACKKLKDSPKGGDTPMAAVVAGAVGALLLVDFTGNILKWPKYKGYKELLLAIDRGDMVKAKECLELGLDVNHCNCRYVNSTTLVSYCDVTPLYFASAKGNAAMVKMLLNHKAHVSQQVNGQTALYIAAVKGNGEVVKVLVEDGKADIWQTGLNNKNILQVATGSARKYLAAYYATMLQ